MPASESAGMESGAGGGGPENVAVVVNADSWASEAVANEFEPMKANYGLGVLHMRQGEFREGETFLRKALTYQITDDPRDQILTDADGNRAVFYDSRYGSNDIFAVGYGGTILRCNGATWSAMTRKSRQRARTR